MHSAIVSQIFNHFLVLFDIYSAVAIFLKTSSFFFLQAFSWLSVTTAIPHWILVCACDILQLWFAEISLRSPWWKFSDPCFHQIVLNIFTFTYLSWSSLYDVSFYFKAIVRLEMMSFRPMMIYVSWPFIPANFMICLSFSCVSLLSLSLSYCRFLINPFSIANFSVNIFYKC